jgi:hypothetical protein
MNLKTKEHKNFKRTRRHKLVKIKGQRISSTVSRLLEQPNKNMNFTIEIAFLVGVRSNEEKNWI